MQVSIEDPGGRLRCHYFEAGRCRSCALIETPYAVQLAEKEARCRAILPGVPEAGWLPAYSGGDRGFRNRVKLVVGGVPGEVTLGILGPDGRGVDLRECAIQSPGIAAMIPSLGGFLEGTGLAPYDVPARRGELKFAHVTESPDGEFMLRFVVRTQHGLDVLRSRLGELRAAVPAAAVVSVNLLPEHRAVLEGEREEVLLGESLPMRLGAALRTPLTLHLRPQSFFQTNTAVARELYAQVASWATAVRPRSVWDLYCGVGGFALHCAYALGARAPRGAHAPGARAPRGTHPLGAGGPRDEAPRPAGPEPSAIDVLGVELSGAAVESAERSAREAGLAARFVAADATDFALRAAGSAEPAPELVIVNPPRRGIGATLADWLERSGPTHLVYSSCNPESLARDLEAMPSYAPREARLFDMFPHTAHAEVAIRLERRLVS